MMSDRWCGKRHKVTWTNFELFAVNLGDSSTAQTIQPFLFMLVGMMRRGARLDHKCRCPHSRNVFSTGLKLFAFAVRWYSTLGGWSLKNSGAMMTCSSMAFKR